MSSTTVTPTVNRPQANAYAAGKLPKNSSLYVLLASWLVTGAVFLVLQLSGATSGFNIVGTIFFGTVLYCVAIYALSYAVEGVRRAKDRLVTALVTTAFVVALLPLISLVFTTVVNGLPGILTPTSFTESQRNVVGAGGGALHAIIGTLLITGVATLISVPIGLLAAIYLTEYGRGRLARAITFFVDVMTGIPSIVAGLFAFALFFLVAGPGARSGVVGAVALSVLMTPVVIRSSEEMLRLVPNELREASYALGVAKWLTIVKVVLRTAVAGLTTGVMISIARVIGETAPLIITVGASDSINSNVFSGNMMTLPVYVYRQFAAGLVPCTPGDTACISTINYDRSWSAALTLILFVMLLNLVARGVSRWFAPKTRA